LFGELELTVQRRVQPLPRLVAIKQLVAKRLDHMIERASDVRHPRLPHEAPKHRQHALRRADFPPCPTCRRRPGEKGAKQLVSAVDQVDLHEPTVTSNPPGNQRAAPSASS